MHPDCVAAYEEASALLASLGHEVEDVAMPLGPDVVPFFETLWYAYATLAPLAPEQEDDAAPADPLPARPRPGRPARPSSSSPRPTCRR